MSKEKKDQIGGTLRDNISKSVKEDYSNTYSPSADRTTPPPTESSAGSKKKE